MEYTASIIFTYGSDNYWHVGLEIFQQAFCTPANTSLVQSQICQVTFDGMLHTGTIPQRTSDPSGT